MRNCVRLSEIFSDTRNLEPRRIRNTPNPVIERVDEQYRVRQANPKTRVANRCNADSCSHEAIHFKPQSIIATYSHDFACYVHVAVAEPRLQRELRPLVLRGLLDTPRGFPASRQCTVQGKKKRPLQ